jgi:hypothetical protein
MKSNSSLDLPVQWQLKILLLDRQRAPEDIRHK